MHLAVDQFVDEIKKATAGSLSIKNHICHVSQQSDVRSAVILTTYFSYYLVAKLGQAPDMLNFCPGLF